MISKNNVLEGKFYLKESFPFNSKKKILEDVSLFIFSQIYKLESVFKNMQCMCYFQ